MAGWGSVTWSKFEVDLLRLNLADSRWCASDSQSKPRWFWTSSLLMILPLGNRNRYQHSFISTQEPSICRALECLDIILNESGPRPQKFVLNQWCNDGTRWDRARFKRHDTEIFVLHILVDGGHVCILSLVLITDRSVMAGYSRVYRLLNIWKLLTLLEPGALDRHIHFQFFQYSRAGVLNWLDWPRKPLTNRHTRFFIRHH